MKKPLIVIAACLAMGGNAGAQVKLGNNPAAINANSLLELESANKGMVAPRVALTAVNSPAPLAAGLLTGTTVYNTANAGTGSNTVYANHYYFWNGVTWSQVADQDASVAILVPVLDNTVATPPVSHTEGDSYLVPSGAGGAWAGNTNKIATWSDNSSSWIFYTPAANNQTTVTTGTNAGKTYKYDGAAWNQVVAPATVYWQPGGNTGLTPANNTLGTSAFLPLRFITKGIERMVVDTLYNIRMGWGNNVASKQLSGAWGFLDSATGTGNGAWVIGYASKALGDRAIALGTGTVASNIYSTSAGFNTTASGPVSTAIGEGTLAAANHTLAANYYTTASGNGSTALGDHTTAAGQVSVAMGYYSKAANPHTGAWGVQDTATGTNAGAWAIGYQNKAFGDRSIALGMTTLASGAYATAIGAFTTASGNSSTAMGEHTTAAGDYSTAAGYYSNAANPHSGAWGVQDTATGTNAGAWAIGYQTKAFGDRAIALGMTTLASNTYATSMGAFSTASGNTSTAMGFQTVASGPQSTAMGSGSMAAGIASTAMGSGTRALQDYATAMGANSVAANPHAGAWGVSDSATGTNAGAWVIGFTSKAMGDRSVALGSYVDVRHSGSFGLGDLSNTSAFLSSTANNQMSARFAGGYVFYTNNTTTIGAALAANGTSWTSVSDRRSKENIQGLGYGLSAVMKLQPVSYRYKGNDNTSIGFIAQDVQAVVPEVVDQTKMGPEHDYLGVRYSELIPVLTKAIQEQQQMIEQLTKRVRDLEAGK